MAGWEEVTISRSARVSSIAGASYGRYIDTIHPARVAPGWPAENFYLDDVSIPFSVVGYFARAVKEITFFMTTLQISDQ
jgi:hypothetical protein